MMRFQKTGFIVAVSGLLISVLAQHGMMRGEKSSSGGCMGGGMMMTMSMPQKVIPMEDGGVLVVMGNRLMKFDKSLKLRNEVELEADTAQVRQMIERMQQYCPMHRQMHQSDAQQEMEPNQPAEEPGKPEEDDEAGE